MGETLARRTVTVSGTDIPVEIVATGNGPALRIEGCPPMVPLSAVHETHRMLSKFSRAGGEGEGLTPVAERMLAVLGELA